MNKEEMQGRDGIKGGRKVIFYRGKGKETEGKSHQEDEDKVSEFGHKREEMCRIIFKGEEGTDGQCRHFRQRWSDEEKETKNKVKQQHQVSDTVMRLGLTTDWWPCPRVSHDDLHKS